MNTPADTTRDVTTTMPPVLAMLRAAADAFLHLEEENARLRATVAALEKENEAQLDVIFELQRMNERAREELP